jgi:membrane dipeptidase
MAKLAGGNMLRVMDAAATVARSLSALPPGDAIDVASR